MKKKIALAILLICVFGMAACDNGSQNETPHGSSSGGSTDTAPLEITSL